MGTIVCLALSFSAGKGKRIVLTLQAIAIGGHLWIHGGSTTVQNDTGDNDTQIMGSFQSTCLFARGRASIMLRTTPIQSIRPSLTRWSNSTVKFQTSGSPLELSNQALWANASANLFYAYNGQVDTGDSYGLSIPPLGNALWRFSISQGLGTGSWEIISYLDIVTQQWFSQLTTGGRPRSRL